MLRGIHDGVQAAWRMYAEFDRLGLIQPVELDLQFDATTSGRLTGFHALDRARLATLPTQRWRSCTAAAGWRAPLMLASLHNVGRLVARKRARLAAQA